jgi:hypothetical protein
VGAGFRHLCSEKNETSNWLQRQRRRKQGKEIFREEAATFRLDKMGSN